MKLGGGTVAWMEANAWVAAMLTMELVERLALSKAGTADFASEPKLPNALAQPMATEIAESSNPWVSAGTETSGFIWRAWSKSAALSLIHI